MTPNPAETWNKRYAEEGFAYGDEPNLFFKENLSSFNDGGKILFVAEGEGRNAVHAAKLGYQSVAFDISESGKMKAEELMLQNKAAFDYIISDLSDFDFENAAYDGVVFIFSHFPKSLQKRAFIKAISSLKEGGILLMECFSENHLAYRSLSNVGGPADIELLYNFSDVRNWTQELQTICLQEELVELSEGKYHQGKGSVIRGIFKKK